MVEFPAIPKTRADSGLAVRVNLVPLFIQCASECRRGMYFYNVYGVSIRSEIELPELVPAAGNAEDVIIRFGRVDQLPATVNSQFQSYWATPTETCLCFQGFGAFLVRNGNEIIISPAPNVEERVIRLAILGPSLSMVLHQRGFLVLHASAVEIDGCAVAFLGNSGEGKSTMAGALHARGHRLIADDLAVVDFESAAHPILLPGFPQLKLWPEVASFLGEDPDKLAQLHPEMEKRARRTRDRFSETRLPLHRLYVLDRDDDPQIESLSPQSAFIELVRHSHDGLLLDETDTAVLHFRQCTRLVNTVSIRRLKRPRILSLLPQVAELIEADITN